MIKYKIDEEKWISGYYEYAVLFISLIEKYGSIRKVSKVTGIPATNIHRWVNKVSTRIKNNS